MRAQATILLIEDSHSQAVAFKLALEQAGYGVLMAANGIEGLRLATTHQPQLIMLDIDLPVMNGFQVLARLKRSSATSHIPVLMLTHREHIGDVMRAIDLRANDYLFKEDVQFHLVDTVAQLLSTPLLPAVGEG